ncbi:putative protein O-mannose kinase [Penaeus vannamei]|uniref:SRR1-like domain-containing protein n=1 Tax=Penaeus vannamei TaxID=6689 RepID=A0A423TS05_PENVA|nr:putative protein O-mannose kinase [Penaeus vannamei]
MDADGFTVVSKKKAAKRRSAKPPADYVNTCEENVEDCLRKIIQAREDLEASEGFTTFRENLNEVKSSQQKEDGCRISSIVCYGLGQVSSSRIARYQTGLLLSIQEFFDVAVEVFDPAFSSLDERVLILNDVDALPQVGREGIICGHREIRGEFVAPEQKWPHDGEEFTEERMPRYSEKVDIWKIPSVCNHFLGKSEEARIFRYHVFSMHRQCREKTPQARPSAGEVLQFYEDLLQRHFNEGIYSAKEEL